MRSGTQSENCALTQWSLIQEKATKSTPGWEAAGAEAISGRYSYAPNANGRESRRGGRPCSNGQVYTSTKTTNVGLGAIPRGLDEL